MAISGTLSSEIKSNALQLEYLKGTLAQITAESVSGRVLVASAEQLLSTASNANWIDRELMYDFFLAGVGLGAEVSRGCASSCIDRGVHSPQRLAMIPSMSTNPGEALRWLELSIVEMTLLLSALDPFVVQQQRALTVLTQPHDQEQVWVEVDSPSSSPEHRELLSGQGTSQNKATSAPPPTPSSLVETGGEGGDFVQQSAELLYHSTRSIKSAAKEEDASRDSTRKGSPGEETRHVFLLGVSHDTNPAQDCFTEEAGEAGEPDKVDWGEPFLLCAHFFEDGVSHLTVDSTPSPDPCPSTPSSPSSQEQAQDGAAESSSFDLQVAAPPLVGYVISAAVTAVDAIDGLGDSSYTAVSAIEVVSSPSAGTPMDPAEAVSGSDDSSVGGSWVVPVRKAVLVPADLPF